MRDEQVACATPRIRRPARPALGVAAFCRWALRARSAALAVVSLSVFLATRFGVAEPFIHQVP